MTRLEALQGIGEVAVQQLKEAGVRSTEALLERGATSRERKQLARQTQIHEKLVLAWVNKADLFRIRGVGAEYMDLLENAGVMTVRELAHRKPANLFQRFEQLNQRKKLVRRLPTRQQVEDWVNQAKRLPPKITY